MDFTTAGGQTFCAESIGTIAILLANGSTIKLERVAYAPKCDSNLISLGQLRDSKITFVNNADVMTLLQGISSIANVRRDQNLFILDLVTPGKVMKATNAKAMTIVDQSCLIDLVSKNKQVRVWHRRLGHASNVRVIRASKLLFDMGNFNTKYDPSEIYSDSDYKDSDNSANETPVASIADISPLSETSNTINIKSAQENEDFDTICLSCIISKQSCATIYKPMMENKEKLEEVHVNLWGPYHSASLLGKKWAAIFLDAKTRKTWIHYL